MFSEDSLITSIPGLVSPIARTYKLASRRVVKRPEINVDNNLASTGIYAVSIPEFTCNTVNPITYSGWHLDIVIADDDSFMKLIIILQILTVKNATNFFYYWVAQKIDDKQDSNFTVSLYLYINQRKSDLRHWIGVLTGLIYANHINVVLNDDEILCADPVFRSKFFRLTHTPDSGSHQHLSYSHTLQFAGEGAYMQCPIGMESNTSILLAPKYKKGTIILTVLVPLCPPNTCVLKLAPFFIIPYTKIS